MKKLLFLLFILYSFASWGQGVGQGYTPTTSSSIDSTRLFQDSILIYYQDGSEIRRDTTRIIIPADPISYFYNSDIGFIADTPLDGWPQNTTQANNSVASVNFRNGIGRYVFIDGNWTLIDFEPKEVESGIGSVTATPNSTGNGTLSWTYRGIHLRTYFVYIRDNPGLNVYVNYFDWDTGTFGQEASWGNPRSNAQDTHAQPSICVTADGHILVTQEQLTGTSTNNHNSAIHIRRSLSPEDISSWAAVSGSPFSANLSYPKFTRLPSGKIMLLHRNYPNDVVNFVSTDNGITWTNFDGSTIGSNANSGTPYIVTYADGSWAYSQGFTLDEGFLLTLDRRLSNNSSAYPQTYGIFTFDGITWGNWTWYAANGNGGFSKDCSASGAITQAELNTNCLLTGVANSNSTTQLYGYVRDVKVKAGYLAVTYTTVLSGLLRIYFKVYDAEYSTVSDVDIYQNTWNKSANYNLVNPMILPINAQRGVFDLLIKEQDGQMKKYSTVDFGTTFTRMAEDLTIDLPASASFRGYGEYSNEYGIQSYIWEDANGVVRFYAERLKSLYAK